MQGANSSGRDWRLVYLTRHLLNELNSDCKLPQIWDFFIVCIKLSNYVGKLLNGLVVLYLI